MIYFVYFAGQGSVLVSLPAFTVNVTNWSSRHRGIVISIIQMPAQIGPMFISVIYYNVYASGDKADVLDQDLTGFFFAMCGLMGGFALMALLGTRHYSTYSTEEDALVGSATEQTLIVDKISDTQKHTSFSDGLRNMETQLVFWAQGITPVAGFIILTNITPMLKSLGFIHLSFMYTTTGPCVALVVKMFVIYISDKFVHKVSRVSISMLLSLLSALLLSFSIGFGHHLPLLVTTYFVAISSAETSYCMLPTYLTEKFDNSMFGYVFSCGTMAPCLINILMQPLSGYLYDIHARGGECFGSQCFQIVIVLAAILQIGGTVLHMVSILWKIKEIEKIRNLEIS